MIRNGFGINWYSYTNPKPQVCKAQVFRRPWVEYSGLTLNQDKATKPQTVQIVRQGEATRYWFKVNPLCKAILLFLKKLFQIRQHGRSAAGLSAVKVVKGRLKKILDFSDDLFKKTNFSGTSPSTNFIKVLILKPTDDKLSFLQNNWRDFFHLS